MMDEVFQEEQSRENLSGADEEAAWYEARKGWYECPYCGNVSVDLQLCCDELHGEMIGE